MRGSFIHIAMFAVVVMVLSISPLSAQQLPERKLVRKGNEQFERRNFNNSLNRYNEALEHAPHSYEAQYNRANAYLQNMLANPQDSTFTDVTSNRYFEQIANNKSLTPEQRGEVLRNLGESLFLQEEYEAALNAFRESLKLSPEDKETKRNYVLTKRIVDQKRNQQQQNNQQQQQQNDQQNDQNNNDQNDNQQQQDNKQQGDQNNDQQQDKGNDNENKPEEQPENGDEPKQDDQQKNGEQPNKEGATPEQERMLDVIQGEEDKTQDKIKDAKQGAVVFGKKNW
ncbi:MAG: tetratricopeptide repeat protein [Alistipes sp.]|nr:tetratricopeptide repeat protein [Alistipes sp.]